MYPEGDFYLEEFSYILLNNTFCETLSFYINQIHPKTVQYGEFHISKY